MRRTGWVLLVFSVVLLAMAGVRAGGVQPRGNPSGELAQKLGAYTCPVIVFIPAVALILVGGRKRVVHGPRQPRRPAQPARESDDYEVVDE